MRLLSYLALSALPLLSLAAKKDSASKFQKLHQKSLSSSPLKLDDSLFNDLTDAPRDFTSVVLLTALPAQFGCEACRQFQPEFEILASSWTKGDKKGESKVVFGALDFPDGKASFQKLMLQTAPVILLYPPTTGPNASEDPTPKRLDFTQGALSAEFVHGWVSRQLPDGPKPEVHRPFNYARAATITTLVLGSITFIGVAGPYLLPVIQNRNLWAAVSLIIILMFTSGHMFNHIRKVPYVSGDGHGGIAYFAGGFGNQFGMETQIVAAMYGVLSFATIALAMKVPRIADAKQQHFAVIVWSLVMFGMYSFLLSVFKIKNGGYPFRLPPF